MHRGRCEIARLDELFDFGDGDSAGLRAERIEVLRGLLVDEVAVAVTDPGVHEGEVAGDGPLEHVLDAVEDRESPSASEASAIEPSRA